MKHPLKLTIAGILLGGVALFQNASASVMYESLPGSNSNHISRHGVAGPVLADDFTPSRSGSVTQIDWWGSAPILTGAADSWEITFHPDAGGAPSTTFPTGKLSQHFVNAGGTDPDADGIYFYTAIWNPMDLFLSAGTDYWFSVANASGGTWTWSNGLAPTVGSEQYDAMVSTGVGPDGGPHFGPWVGIADTDFAFRIHTVPEPATLVLMMLGLAGLGFSIRGKRN